MNNQIDNTKEMFDKAEEYWINKLSDTVLENSLSDIVVSKDDKYNEKYFTFEKEQYSKIRKICKDNDLAIYVFLLTVYKIFIYRYTNTNDIIVTAPVLKKNATSYNKFVVFRDEFNKHNSFKEMLTNIKNTVVEGYKNQFYPIRKIFQKIDNYDSSFLFNFVLTYNEIHDYDELKSIISQYKNQIILSVEREEDCFKCKIEYKKDLFAEEFIDKIIVVLKQIVNQVVSNLDIKIEDIEVFSVEEKNRIIHDFNLTTNLNYKKESIITLFEQVVNERADDICLTFIKKIEGQYKYENVSYKEINIRANKIGRLLIEKGIKKNDIVSLIMESSIEMYICILGVLKAGATYLPLDKSYPFDRIDYTVRDSKSKILLTNVDCIEKDIEKLEVDIINVNNIDLSKYSSENINLDIKGEDVAYIIYTSGTTGKPKGVLIDNENVVNTLQFRSKLHDLSEKDVILQLNTYVFDGFVATFFTPLISGARIIAIEEKNITDIDTLKEAIYKNKVTHFASIPLLFKEMIDNIEAFEFESVKSVVLAGDKVRSEIIENSNNKFKNTKIIVEYGVSECSVLSTYATEFDESKNKYIIGKPIDNTKVYVLNGEGLIQPIGVIGELCISGQGVSNKGYLNNAKLTSEKFIKNPFEDNTILYKTGDLVRWNNDGVLEYFGRKDTQVKIRGFRIELGEIENHIVNYENIENVVVIARKMSHDNSSEDSQLCAYYILQDKSKKIDIGDLKEYLSRYVPMYMIPTFFCEIEKFPLTTNNKINYSKLPEPKLNYADTRELPYTPTQKKLAKIWSELLEIDLDVIGIESNFFELGGHSLNVTKLLAKINEIFEVKISIPQIYEKSTLGKIAQIIDNSVSEERTIINKVRERDYYNVSSAQKRMYFLQQFNKEGTAYNLTSVNKLTGKVDIDKIEKVFNKLIDFNEVLRTSFHVINGEVYQKIHNSNEINFKINYYDCNNLLDEDVSLKIDSLVAVFDLSKPNLLRVNILSLSENEYIMMIDMHHIIADGISVKLLMEQFTSLYNGQALIEEELQYKDYAQWQLEQRNKSSTQRAYWIDRLKGKIPELQLPKDFPRPDIKKFKGNIYKFDICNEDAASIKDIADKNNTSVFVVMLSIYYVFLYKMANENELIVGVPTSGRRRSEVSNMIGMFANTLPIKTIVQGECIFEKFVNHVKNNVLNDLENEEYQYEDIIKDLKVERKLGNNPLFDTMFNFEDIDIPKFELDNVIIEEYNYIRSTSKFDLTLNCISREKDLKLEFEYDTDLFSAETIENYSKYLKKIISEVTTNSKIEINKINILSKEEIDYLFNSYNATQRNYPKEKTIVDLFCEQVRKVPNNIALRLNEDVITYEELDKLSNRTANIYKQNGLEKGDKIAIMMDRSFEFIISILAALKSGITYIPIGLEYSNYRVEYILEHSKVKALLTTSSNNIDSELINKLNCVIYFDESNNEVNNGNMDEFINVSDPSDSAYIIYTSGSTGTPKGVEIGNRSLTNYVYWAKEQYISNTNNSFPLFTSISFDLTVTSIFTPLISGNIVEIYNEEDSIKNLEKILNDNKVQVIKLTPSHLKVMKYIKFKNESIKKIIVGGEKLTTKLANEIYLLFNKNVDIINEYGPTEATVGCMIYHYNEEIDQYESVPIGKPSQNVQIYILDKHMQLVPKGIQGEMYISGDSLAKGYIYDEVQTKEKFIKNIFNEDKVMYKTGDIAKMNEAGDLVYVDRIDRQVKLNGYRIDLYEIENAISSLEEVKESVILIENSDDEKNMISFIMLERNISIEEIKNKVSKILPKYMLPNQYIVVENIPINKNGKIDRNSLLKIYNESNKPILNNIESDEKIEERITDIWSKVINKNNIGKDENFFEVGGDSISALKLTELLNKEFDLEISITLIFEYPTIRLMTEYFNENCNSIIENNNVDLDDEESIEEISIFEENIQKFMGDDDE